MTQTINSTDLELMDAYRYGDNAGDGEACGESTDSPREAAEREGWTVVRAIYEGTNGPGTPVLADNGAGALYVICDQNGPWAVRVGDCNGR